MKLTPIIQKAINTATRLHHGQIRKTDNTLPYIVHPFSVAWIVSQYTDDENTITAALLHDVLEDVVGYSAEDMRRDFGEKITSIVQEVSEDKDPSKENNDPAVWMTRKLGYITHLRSASSEAMLVCAADKIHNLRSLVAAHQLQGDAMWAKFNSPSHLRLWFYKEVLDILKERFPSEIVNELEVAYSEARTQLITPFFAVFVVREADFEFDAFLINPSNTSYARVHTMTGGFAGDDNGVLETSKPISEKGQLLSHSALKLETSDLGDLDFNVWYCLDLFVGETDKSIKLSFSLPKYWFNYEKEATLIPLLNRTGMVIELSPREKTIEDESKGLNLAGGYTKTS